MTVITHNRRKSQLSKIIDAAGGVSVGTALTQARANLDALRPRILEEVSARIAELERIQPAQTPDETHARLALAYRAANGVIDSAGPFEMDELCKAALGLCDLIDAATPARPFDWRVLLVFSQSMRLLIALPPEAADERSKVRASLDQLVERKLAQP